MAKKIRFVLEMEDGTQIRTIEDLREHFLPDEMLEYVKNGTISRWLRERYLDDKAQALENLEDMKDGELLKRVCEILDVAYDKKWEETSENIEMTPIKREMLEKLHQYTEEKKYDDVVESIAFEQDDLYDLLDEDATTIYLCGDRFSIPLAKSGITYVGINNPIVVIDSKTLVDFADKKIKLEAVRFDEKYQKLLGANEGKSESCEGLLELVNECVETLCSKSYYVDYRSNDEGCGNFAMHTINTEKYGSEKYMYDSKLKAKHACREQVDSMIEEAIAQYQEKREVYCEAILQRKEKIQGELSDILQDISIELEDFMSDCESEDFVKEVEELCEELNLCERFSEYELEDKIQNFINKILPEQPPVIKKATEYMEMCTYDELHEEWAYRMKDAARDIAKNMNKYARKAIDKLSEGLDYIYSDIIAAFGLMIAVNADNYLVKRERSFYKPELLDEAELAKKLLDDKKDEKKGNDDLMIASSIDSLLGISSTAYSLGLSSAGSAFESILNAIDDVTDGGARRP